MGGNLKRYRLTRQTLGNLLVLGFAGTALLAASGVIRGKENPRPGSHTTVEPSLPLTLDVRLVNLQKNSRGGVASLALDVASAVDLDEVTVSAKLPGGVVFSDGTHSQTWKFDSKAKGTLRIPTDLLVGYDGKFPVSVEVNGTFRGNVIHRAMSYKLLVGGQEGLPPVRDGAIEFQGVPEGGRP